jgi:hypothetical protein
MKLLLERWNKFLNESKLAVFDFDDTLAVSDSKIILTKASGEVIEMTPAEYNVYAPVEGDSFDYSQFEEVINPQEVTQITRIMTNHIEKENRDPEGRKIAVLTSRADPAKNNIINYLKSLNIDMANVEVITLGDSDPYSKKSWIEAEVRQGGFDKVLFFDDSQKNIDAVGELIDEMPEVSISVRPVGYSEQYK